MQTFWYAILWTAFLVALAGWGYLLLRLFKKPAAAEGEPAPNIQSKFWSLLFGGVILAEVLLVLITPVMDWGLPKNVGNLGGEVDNLFHLILAVTGIVFILTEGLMVYYMYIYAGEPGRKTVYVHGNHRLELIWTAVPAVILLFLAFTQVGAWERIKYQSRFPEPDQIFEVSARQFEWRIRYSQDIKPAAPEEWSRREEADDLHVVNEVHTWKGANAKLYLKTRDVLHSFFLPNLRIKQDALPGKTIPVWFNATEANCREVKGQWVVGFRYDEKSGAWEENKEYVWELACAELCGWGHYKMQGRLYVHQDKADYERWLKKATAVQNSRAP